MTTTSQLAVSPAPTTTQLIDHATQHGIRVCWAPPTWHRQAGYADSTIWLRRDLTDAETRSLLAHEIAHHHMGHTGPQPPEVEERVWEEAALMLITIDDYADAEEVHGWHSPAIAEELGVTREVVSAFRRILGRIS